MTLSRGGYMSKVFKAARRFAPKTRKTTIQLKDDYGLLLEAAGTTKAFQHYFQTLYCSPAHPPAPLTLQFGLHVTWREWYNAVSHTQERKAVPKHYAPGLLWRECPDILADRLSVIAHFPEGPLEFAECWTEAHLALLPKPPKTPSKPQALRPINLLDPCSKALGAILAQRRRPYTWSFLEHRPQFAYMPGAPLLTRLLALPLDAISSGSSCVLKEMHHP